MRSANVFLTAAGGGQTPNVKASAPKTDGSKTASVFASMMSANYSASMNASKDNAGIHTQPSGNSRQAEGLEQASAYDRYQYRENPVAAAEGTPFADKLAGSGEELEGFEEAVTEMVAEKLGITEEEVVQAMETLGLTAFDLLNPQNLVQLAMTLTGAESGMELLMNPEYLELTQAMQTLGEELMAELDLPMDQMDALIAQMDALEKPAEFTEAMPEENSGTLKSAEESEPTLNGRPEVTAEQEGEAPEKLADAEVRPEAGAEYASADQPEEDVPTMTGEQQVVAAEKMKEAEPADTAAQPEEAAEEKTDTAEPVQVRPENEPEDKGSEDAFADRRESDARATARQEPAVSDPAIGIQNAVNEMKPEMAPELSQLDSSYLSVDTVDLMEQVVEKLKVTVTEGLSSMEMTLNPENLGKVYIQISAREGAVHAQIAAANEAVKNALEAQVAEIQENLNQAGVKVEAIEVTVASHEFERNLEQNQKREEQEGERAQENSRRRNLNLSSLDELSGVMSEEEALVAQIMRDNGNTVDLSA